MNRIILNPKSLAYTVLPSEFSGSQKDRRLFLEDLAISLIKPLVQQRNSLADCRNYSGLNKFIVESFRRVGEIITRRKAESSNSKSKNFSYS